MSDFLESIKEDLLDGRRLPYLIGLGVLLLGAVVFVVIGGSGSSSTSPTSASTPPAETTPAGAVAVTKAQNTAAASAEVSNGNPTKSQSVTRNFFEPLAGSKTSVQSTPSAASSSKSSSSSSGAGSGSSSPSPKQSGGSTPATSTPSTPATSTPSTPATPPKSKPKQKSYDVALLFGVASPPPQSSQLTPYENAKRGLELPSHQVPLVTFTGWSSGGKGATFKLDGEAILHGDGTCLPSPTQCETLELKPGKAEQLEYLPANGQAVTYELQVVSIEPSAAKAARSARAARARRAARVARAHAARDHRRRHGARRR